MAKTTNNKPLEVASFANKAHEEAVARKAREEKKAIDRHNKIWGTVAGIAMGATMLYAFFAWLLG